MNLPRKIAMTQLQLGAVLGPNHMVICDRWVNTICARVRSLLLTTRKVYAVNPGLDGHGWVSIFGRLPARAGSFGPFIQYQGLSACVAEGDQFADTKTSEQGIS